MKNGSLMPSSCRNHIEKYLLAAKELVYDTFMLGVSQAPLNALHRVEGEAVANLQSSSSYLADNTREAYRIVFSDYKVFPSVFFVLLSHSL